MRVAECTNQPTLIAHTRVSGRLLPKPFACPQGFLPNKRQQRMAGLAALEFAQALQQLVADRRAGKTSTAGNAGASVTARCANPSGRCAKAPCHPCNPLLLCMQSARLHLCASLPSGQSLPAETAAPPCSRVTNIGSLCVQPRVWLARRHGHHCALAPAGGTQRPGQGGAYKKMCGCRHASIAYCTLRLHRRDRQPTWCLPVAHHAK